MSRTDEAIHYVNSPGFGSLGGHDSKIWVVGIAQLNDEPVEISTRMLPGEWTPEVLAESVASYQCKLREMGAPENEFDTDLRQPDDGSAIVRVSWQHSGIHTFADLGHSVLHK